MTSLDIACIGAALIVAGLLIVVMQKTDHDQKINRHDSLRVQWLRRLGFICAALILLLSARYSIVTSDWQTTWLLIVVASGYILGVNVVALQKRSPPTDGHKIRNPSFRLSHFIERLVSYFSFHR